MVGLRWRTDLSADEWDSRLAQLQGHPLQSALWGEARRTVDGIDDHRWAAFNDDRAVLLARCEVRRIPPFWRAAWVPRGPAAADDSAGGAAFADLLDQLRSAGFLLCIDDRYSGTATRPGGVALPPAPRTAVVDLTPGPERVWAAIDRQWRYGVRSAGRYGVVVEESRAPQDADVFFALCESISTRKKFDLPGSAALIKTLLAAPVDRPVEARLFVARVDGRVAGGAVVLRCGRSLHYFWGAVDRTFAKQRPGEAVHGAIIDWAIGQGIARYDLEGISPKDNPGTYQFKMKMGAAEVELPGRRAYPFGALARMLVAAGRRVGRL